MKLPVGESQARIRTRSAVLGALLSGILAFVVSAFGFASATLFATCILVVAYVAERVSVGSS